MRQSAKRIGEKMRPGGRDFAERRAVVERGRSATWQVTIALIAATVGATALGYLAVQLYYLPTTLREARLNRVPSLTGMDVEDAADRGEGAGYAVSVVGRDYSTEVERGEVIYQSPPPDMFLPRGDTLRVLVSLGPPDERIPDVAGLELGLARRVFSRMGLRVAEVSREPSDVHPQGTVLRTDPPAGTRLDSDEPRRRPAVVVVLSRGGSHVVMPDVRDLTLAQARDTLEVYGLTVGEVTGLRESEEPEAGRRVVVTAQDPATGRMVTAGSAVELTLGPARPRRPAEQIPSPDGGAAAPRGGRRETDEGAVPEAEVPGVFFEDVPAPSDSGP